MIEIDAELGRQLDARRHALPEAGAMIDEIARSVGAGGKRLRPQFCYWGFRACEGEHGEAIVRAAAALEFLHTFAIVHDDIMDRSDERRGLPTTVALHGMEKALLVGDLALVFADAALLESGFAGDRLMQAFGHYSRMRQEVIAGQYMDLVAASDRAVTVERARRIAVLKSGRYSIQEPLVIGAALAGASPALIASLNGFGAPLGEAFQLRDDLLGTFGDAGTVGKPVDSDVREGKRHVLFALTLEALGAPERDAFVQRWGGGDRLSDSDVDELRAVIERCGARARTEELLDDLRTEALGRLEAIDLAPEARVALVGLTDRATDRAL